MFVVHALLGLAALLPAANHDNNVEWSGLSHLDTMDRRPLCPVDGESFTVYFQTYDFDVVSARVFYDDGGAPRWIPASYSHDRGPYDVWKATLPCTDATALVTYYIELTDGSDTDYIGPAGPSDGPPASGWQVNYSTLGHAPLGATLVTGGAVFKVWGLNATTCHVAGQFNGWNSAANPMTKSGDYFTARINSVTQGQMYKYVFNGSHWKPDSRARQLHPGDNYNSFVRDPDTYSWLSSVDFDVPNHEDMIVYQLHVGTYAGRNDGNNFVGAPATYRSIVDSHLTHLVDLGINVVQLMPITEFPTDWSGGYNPVTQWGVEWKSGDPDDFKYMIDKFHAAGIAVTIDVVWNHFSPTDNYLWLYTNGAATGQVYFDGNGSSGHWNTPWGAQADFDRLPVRDYFAHSALYWTEEYRLDGFRFDGTDYMSSPNGQSTGWGLMQRMNDDMNRRSVDKIAYAEQLPDDYWVTRPTSQGGTGYDSQYQDKYVDDLRTAIFAAAGATGSANITNLRNAIFGDFNDGSNVVTVGQTTTQTLKYLELHDEAWAASGGQRLVRSIDTTFPHDDQYARGRSLYGYAVTMFSPGIPAFFMGCEFLEDTNFEANTNNRIDWNKPTTYANYLQAFKDMIRIRKQNPGFRSNAGVQITRTDEAKDIFTMHRWDGSGNDLLVVASLANEDQTNYRIGFPQPGVWHELFNSQAAVYGGNGSGNGGSVTPNLGPFDSYNQSANITVPLRSVTVFRLATCTGDEQCDDSITCTADACVQGGCVHTPNNGLCGDDGLFCNGTEYCSAGAGCVSTGYPCDRKNCDEATNACTTVSVHPFAELLALTDCLNGPQQSPDPIETSECTASCLAQFDLDTDDDVDLRDYYALQQAGL